MTATLKAQAAVIATAAIFGLTYGLSAPLIALDLAKAGYGETAIGANAAMHALGVLVIAPFLPRLAFAWGARRLAITALLAAAVLLAAFPAAPTLWLWFPLRIALGAASETLFVISETWLNQLAAERSRARTMAVYTAALSSGFALGPLIIVAVGGEGPWAFLIGAGLSLGACLLTLLAGAKSPPMERPGPVTTMRYLRLAPVAIAAVALNAALETAGLGLLALYAIGLGWSEDPATLLISTLMIGAILLQLPIGWLGDRMDRTRLVIILAALSTAGALIWPVALGEAWLAYPLLFLWGGAFAGIYTIMLTLVGERFRDAELVGIYAVMSVAWGLGALVGPGLGGVAMEMTLHGLPMFAALLCGGFTLFAVLRARAERM